MSIISQIRDFDHAIDILDEWLRGLDYTRAARDGIRTHVEIYGDLVGVVPHWLEAEHLEPATEILVDALPPVGYYSPEWAEEPFDGYWTPNDTGQLVPPELEDEIDFPDAPDHAITTRPGYWESLEADGIGRFPAISGGEADEPFEPTAEDWADWAEMQEEAAVRSYLARRGLDIDRRQVTDDELAQLAAHGCI